MESPAVGCSRVHFETQAYIACTLAALMSICIFEELQAHEIRAMKLKPAHAKTVGVTRHSGIHALDPLTPRLRGYLGVTVVYVV